MAVWTIVIMVILAVAIGVFVFLTFATESSNKKKQQANILYPFTGQLAPPSPPWTVNQSSNNPGTGKEPEDGLFLVGMNGGESATVPQIQCPAGYKINVVGAFLDVIDPYGECSNTPDSTLQLTCGDGSDTTNAATCTTGDDSTCASGMSCIGGKCVPKQCSANTDCGGSSASGTVQTCGANFGASCKADSDCSTDGSLACIGGTCLVDPGVTSCMACVDPSTGLPPGSGVQGYCASMPLCMGVEDGLNGMCSPSKGDSKKCRPRDATAYLAAHCDGKQTCLGDPSDVWTPKTPGGPFGPLPCQIPASSNNSDYAQLPAINGWGGGTPTGGAGDAEPVTFSQGYYVHGIYTCVPDDENATSS